MLIKLYWPTIYCWASFSCEIFITSTHQYPGFYVLYYVYRVLYIVFCFIAIFWINLQLKEKLKKRKEYCCLCLALCVHEFSRGYQVEREIYLLDDISFIVHVFFLTSGDLFFIALNLVIFRRKLQSSVLSTENLKEK